MLRTLPLLIALVLGLAACTPPAPLPPQSPRWPRAHALRSQPAGPALLRTGRNYRALQARVSLQSLQGLSVAGVELQQVRPLGQAFLYRAP